MRRVGRSRRFADRPVGSPNGSEVTVTQLPEWHGHSSVYLSVGYMDPGTTHTMSLSLAWWETDANVTISWGNDEKGIAHTKPCNRSLSTRAHDVLLHIWSWKPRQEPIASRGRPRLRGGKHAGTRDSARMMPNPSSVIFVFRQP